MSGLEAAAASWVIEVSPQSAHLLRTRDWARRLAPDAGEPLAVAALLHDIERAFPDRSRYPDPTRHWDDPEYLRWHQTRSAAIGSRWLRTQGATAPLLRHVERLIAAHEVGGWPEADVLQAADSISFLETMAEAAASWSRDEPGPSSGQRKLRQMHDRIRFAPARPHSERFLRVALNRIGGR